MSTVLRPSSVAYGTGGSAPNSTKGSAYEGLCKAYIAMRLQKLLSWPCVFTCISLALITADLSGPRAAVNHLFSLTSFAWPFISFLLGVIPPLVLRKMTMNPQRNTKVTLAAQLNCMATQLSAWRLLATYSASSLAFTIPFIYLSPDSAKFSIFKSTTLYPWHLNERFVFLVSSGVLTGLIFAGRLLIRQQSVIRWVREPERRMGETIKVTLWSQVWELGKISLGLSILFPISYILLRRQVFRASLFFAKPFIYNFLRSRLWALSLGLCIRSGLLSLVMIGLWHVSGTMLDVYLAQPSEASQYTTNPTETLVSGITSKASGGYYQGFALAELARLAQGTDSTYIARRKTIFSDLKNPPSISAWSMICRHTLLALGKDYRILLGRGASSTAAPSSTPPASVPSVTRRSPSAVKRTNIYAAAPNSPADRFIDNVNGYLNMADGVVGQAAQSLSIPSVLSSMTPKKPSTQNTTSASNSSSTWELIPSPTSMASSLFQTIKNRLPPPASSALEVFGHNARKTYSILFEPTIERKVEASLPNMQLDVWAIESLCHLAAASFTEDPYGIVQRDIPRILEAMLSFQNALEAFKIEVNDPRCEGLLEPITSALGTGLHAIIFTFRDRLSAFKFSPVIGKKLQDLVDVQ